MNYFFSLVLPSSFLLYFLDFFPQQLFLCPVDVWLLLTAQPLSDKQICIPAKCFLTSEPPLVSWLAEKPILTLRDIVLILHRKRTKGIESVS